MVKERQIIRWLRADDQRYQAIQVAADLQLKDWCLAAGFVRNLVWDQLYFNRSEGITGDIDLIYFDESNTTKAIDLAYENTLKSLLNLPWSVKNQARMHVRNHDNPYRSTLDAMSYWPELETAIGVTQSTNGELQLLAPFGVETLFAKTITFNKNHKDMAQFHARVKDKAWLKKWPELALSTDLLI